jgi:hypothetical protein
MYEEMLDDYYYETAHEVMWTENEMPREDGYGEIPTIGELKGMMGEIEKW